MTLTFTYKSGATEKIVNVSKLARHNNGNYDIFFREIGDDPTNDIPVGPVGETYDVVVSFEIEED